MTKPKLIKQYFEQSHLFDEKPELLFQLLFNCIEYRYNDLFFKYFRNNLIDFIYNVEVDISVISLTLLHKASYLGNLEIVKYLVEQGSDINHIFDETLATPLHYAASNNKLDVVKYLIEKGANVNHKDKDGNTPIEVAIRYGHTDTIEYLKSIQK